MMTVQANVKYFSFKNLFKGQLIVYNKNSTVLWGLKYIALIVYCCITNYLPNQWLKEINNYYLTVAVGWEFRSGSAGWVWLSISHESPSRYWLGQHSSESLTGALGSSSKMLTHMGICMRPQCFTLLGLSIRLPVCPYHPVLDTTHLPLPPHSVVRNESLRIANTQEERNQDPPFEGSSIKKYVKIL